MMALKLIPLPGRPHDVSRERYPNGTVSRHRRGLPDVRSPTVYHRLVALGTDPKYVGQIAILLCHRALNETEAFWAQEVGDVCRSFNRLKPYAPRVAKSPDYNRSGGTTPDISELPNAAELIEEFKGRFAEVKAEWDIIQTSYDDWQSRGAIETLCIDGDSIHSSYYPKLRKFLNKAGEKLELHRKKREKGK